MINLENDILTILNKYPGTAKEDVQACNEILDLVIEKIKEAVKLISLEPQTTDFILDQMQFGYNEAIKDMEQKKQEILRGLND